MPENLLRSSMRFKKNLILVAHSLFMKPLLVFFSLLISLHSYGQKHTEYTLGLKKTGTVIKNIEGQFIVTDSTVTSILDGQKSTLKITKRDGYTFHVTDGTTTGKYVISHAKGRLHGFTYDSSIAYHPAKHVKGEPIPVFLSSVKRD